MSAGHCTPGLEHTSGCIVTMYGGQGRLQDKHGINILSFVEMTYRAYQVSRFSDPRDTHIVDFTDSIIR